MGKKILILSNHFITLYNFRKELINRLIEEKHEVYLSMPKADENKYFEDLACKIIETEVDRRGNNPINDIKLVLSYIKIINEIKPDVVLTYTVKPNLYGGIACIVNRTSYICNVTGLGSGYQKGGLVQRIIKILSKISFRNATKVFIQNESNMRFLISSNMLNNNYDLIPGSGVNLESYKIMRYPDKDKVINFNFIARVMKEKGIDEYLEAAKKIKTKYSNVVFNVTGMIDEPYYKDVLDKYQKAGIIKYNGFQSDIKPYIEKCNCIINPSYSEGMSNVLLEGAACGRPVIASNIPGCKEIVDNNISGYIFKVKSVENLVEKIEDFIKLTYEEQIKMGKCGRIKVEKEFDRNIIVDKYIEVINTIH